MTVAQFGIRLRCAKSSDMQVIPNLPFPYEIDSGKSLIEWTDAKEMLKRIADAGKKPSDIKCVWFQSATRREYTGKLDKKVIERLGSLQEKMQGSPNQK